MEAPAPMMAHMAVTSSSNDDSLLARMHEGWLAGNPERAMDISLRREETIMTALALMTGMGANTSELEISPASSDPGLQLDEEEQGSMILSSSEGISLLVSAADAQAWGRALWVAAGMPESNLSTINGEYAPRAIDDGSTVRLESPNGQTIWSGTQLQAELLGRALSLPEHAEALISGVNGSALIKGRGVGIELLTDGWHGWLMPMEADNLQAQLTGTGARRGNRDNRRENRQRQREEARENTRENIQEITQSPSSNTEQPNLLEQLANQRG